MLQVKLSFLEELCGFLIVSEVLFTILHAKPVIFGMIFLYFLLRIHLPCFFPVGPGFKV